MIIPNDCFPLNTSTLKLILENTTQLESLSITNCAKITNFSSTAYCPLLKELEIEKTVNFCDLDLADIVQNRALTKLRLRNCPNVTSDGIKEVLRMCPLEELELNLCEEIDDKVLEELPLTKTRLKSLALHGCNGVTSSGIKRLVRHKQPRVLSRLAEMDLSRNKNICNEAIRSLHKALLRLEKSKVKTLTVYVTQTSVSRDVEKELTSRIQVIF
ncbi:F-box/LRR-repeat protein 20-like isoform 1 [Aphelenchoides avenae]|nr:F-box/LRR-repeat protein 20-like isoform 1 [Aphelenchus avenae]